MKISRSLVGKIAEITWRDPGTATVASHDRRNRADVPSGMTALATQREYGIIDNITDGVVRVVHTIGTDPVHVTDPTDEFTCTWVHEALIERCVIYQPMQRRRRRRGRDE